MLSFLSRWLRFFRFVNYNFKNNACQYRAAALTFTTLLSLVPFLSVSFAILSAFPISAKFNEQIQNFIFKNFVPTAGETVKNYLNQFVEQTAHISLVGSIFLIITAVTLLYTIEQAFNAIWHVQTPRRGIFSLLLYWAILSITPLLVGASFAFSNYVYSFSIISHTIQLPFISPLLLAIAPFLFSTITFTLIYIAIPNCTVPLRYPFAGGIIAALLFELAKQGFSIYLHLFPTYEIVYGTLAAIPIFLIWLYLSWLIILVGAEISHAFTFYSMRSVQFPLDGFTHAFCWLGYLWQAQQNGHGLSLHELINRDHYNYQINPQEQITYLTAANLIQPTINGRYMISCDFHHFTLAQLYRSLPWPLPSANALEVFSDPKLQTLINQLKKFDASIECELAVSLYDLYKNNLDKG